MALKIDKTGRHHGCILPMLDGTLQLFVVVGMQTAIITII
jgi:hypothetical protein